MNIMGYSNQNEITNRKEARKYYTSLPFECRKELTSKTNSFGQIVYSKKPEESPITSTTRYYASCLHLERIIDTLEKTECYNIQTARNFFEKFFKLSKEFMSAKFDLSPRTAEMRCKLIELLIFDYIPYKMGVIKAYNNFTSTNLPSISLQDMATSRLIEAYNVCAAGCEGYVSKNRMMDAVKYIIDYVRYIYDIYQLEKPFETDELSNIYIYYIYLKTSSSPLYIDAKTMFKERIVEPIDWNSQTSYDDENNNQQKFPNNLYQNRLTGDDVETSVIREFGEILADNSKKQFSMFGDNVFKFLNIEHVMKELRYLNKDTLSQFANIMENESIVFKLPEQLAMYVKNELNCPMCEVQMIRDGAVDYISCIEYEGDTYVLFTTTSKPDTVYGISMLTGKDDITQRKLLSFDKNDDTEFELVVDFPKK